MYDRDAQAQPSRLMQLQRLLRQVTWLKAVQAIQGSWL